MKRSLNVKNGKVLVLGNDNRSFLSVCRSLGRKGICVHVGWCEKNLPAIKSRYINTRVNIPTYSKDKNNWKNILINILKKEKYDLVIPCDDQSIIPLQHYKKEFERICKIYLLDDKTYSLANDKYQMQKLAKSLGINVPKEIELSKTANIDFILSELSLPLVIKPKSSFTINRLDKKNYVKKYFSKKELQIFLDNMNDSQMVIAQKNFIGKGVGVELLAHNGEILYVFEHIRIHEPLTGGGSSYRKSVPLHPELLEASKKLMKALNYTGVAMVEFKVNFKTSQWVFIELNARFWGSLPLAIASGADFPFFLYMMLVHQKTTFVQYYDTNIYCRNVAKDIKWIISNLRADRSNQALETLPLKEVFSEIKHILRMQERLDTVTIDDIKPGIYSFINIMSKSYIKIKEKLLSKKILRLTQINKAMDLLKSAESLLFICKGNICRSPFAHYYLESFLLDSVSVESCGYYPQDGRSCPSNGIEAAKKFGLDMTSHRSKQVSSDLISEADIIFTFDEANYQTVKNKFPLAKDKLYRIGLFSQSGLVIKDPYGENVKYFDEIYQLIAQAIDSIVKYKKS